MQDKAIYPAMFVLSNRILDLELIILWTAAAEVAGKPSVEVESCRAGSGFGLPVQRTVTHGIGGVFFSNNETPLEPSARPLPKSRILWPRYAALGNNPGGAADAANQGTAA
jgi:hypothetical protein